MTVPENAIGGTVDNVKVTATGTKSGGWDICTAQVAMSRGVSVSISPGDDSGVNGATLEYTVTVSNTGNVEDNYTLSPSDDAGWSPSVLPTSIVVDAFSSEDVTLSVTIPSDAIGGTVDNLIVEADGTDISDSAGCTAQATIFRDVGVAISPSDNSGANGATLTYIVTVSNTGNVPDEYSLTPSDDAEWSPSVLPTSLVVAPFGGSEEATLSVTIPLDATVGAVDDITVQADGTGVSNSDICTARLMAISIDPSSGPVGTEVTVTGSGFTADGDVDIYFDGGLVVTTTAGDDGTIFTTFNVPTVSAGDHDVFSYTDTYSGVVTFTVVPAITLSPSSGLAATTVSGTGFTADSVVTIMWDDNVMPTVPQPVNTTSNGSFTAIVSVLTQTVPGEYTVTATDGADLSASATFTIENMTGPSGPQGPSGDTGPQGPQGPSGENGAIGPQGPSGENGVAGENGATWYFGTSAPSNSMGHDNDYYLDNSSWNVYLKVSGSWTLVGNIKGATGDTGPQGPAGENGANGQTPMLQYDGPNNRISWYYENGYQTEWITLPAGPSGENGINGQTPILEYNSENYSIRWLYDNGYATSWMVLPQGPTGDSGPAGPQGQTGSTGPAGSTGEMGPQGLPGVNGTNGITPQFQYDNGNYKFRWVYENGTYTIWYSLPVGPQGPSGENGAIGPQGPQGGTASYQALWASIGIAIFGLLAALFCCHEG